jgi:hypothetical protein
MSGMMPGRMSLLSLVAIAASACSGGGSTAEDAGVDVAFAFDTGLPDDYVPIPRTLACSGDASSCLSGTFAVKDFKAKPTATRVSLFRVFPRGDVQAVSWTPVAKDGTFAFSHLEAWGHYYLQGEARFGNGSKATSVISNVGSFSAPSAQSPIAIVVRPVFLEALQEGPSGAPPTLAWASAHLFDPTSGDEVTTGTVSLTANGKTYPMPYGLNSAGAMSFNVTLPANTPGGGMFSITTSSEKLGASPTTWKLEGAIITFGGKIVSPSAGSVPADKPLAVTWQAQPDASFTQTELFEMSGGRLIQRYLSPTVNAPDVTKETIPASDLTSGMYLLNVDYTNATCPPSADGCVYNIATAAENLTVK